MPLARYNPRCLLRGKQLQNHVTKSVSIQESFFFFFALIVHVLSVVWLGEGRSAGLSGSLRLQLLRCVWTDAENDLSSHTSSSAPQHCVCVCQTSVSLLNTAVNTEGPQEKVLSSAAGVHEHKQTHMKMLYNWRNNYFQAQYVARPQCEMSCFMC